MLHMSQYKMCSVCTSKPAHVFMTLDNMTVVFGFLHVWWLSWSLIRRKWRQYIP